MFYSYSEAEVKLQFFSCGWIWIISHDVVIIDDGVRAQIMKPSVKDTSSHQMFYYSAVLELSVEYVLFMMQYTDCSKKHCDS